MPGRPPTEDAVPCGVDSGSVEAKVFTALFKSQTFSQDYYIFASEHVAVEGIGSARCVRFCQISEAGTMA